MYCTGGIRSRKLQVFFSAKVYHLEGGILKYLEEAPETESLWEGECFVFDKRVSVEHGLAQGTFKLCYGCKQLVSDADMKAAWYEYGVSCPYCYTLKPDEEKEREREQDKGNLRLGASLVVVTRAVANINSRPNEEEYHPAVKFSLRADCNHYYRTLLCSAMMLEDRAGLGGKEPARPGLGLGLVNA
ncbi:hypothetical protein RJ641_005784 [Dillenia turbinata]|uniref:Rhodanese domain-containing protein n=1 Tax=Dillenia turbinata TaxID=194707 RepID=A0AAN8Z7L3_9MAGN